MLCYLTADDVKRQHHREVVEEELHSHPEKYPALHPAQQIPQSVSDQVKEVEEFDKMYRLPKQPEAHIKPSL
ncbi:hypothetical protein ACOMHN_028661 [Nucella lapillus]